MWCSSMLVYLGSCSQKKPSFNSQHNCPYCIINIPWYNTTICSRSHGLVFLKYVTAARHDQYNPMCSIEAHETEHKSIDDEAGSGGGRPLP